MLYIKDKANCCGCSACVQSCPKHCISLCEDEEGFLYPHADAKQCIECGLCEKVCPILNPQSKLPPLQVLAAKNRNLEDRLNSSSGGLFIALARQVISRNGVVFGAVYDECWEVHHISAETIEDVYPMMGSKYVQSRIENTYHEAEAFLKQGREVMFVGSPCQIAGLHAFLRHKDYPNLLAVDFVCHGVPCPGVWRRYLAETYSGYSAKKGSKPPLAAAGKNTVLYLSLNAKSPIGDIKFRDKTESGWKKYRFVVRGKSAAKADQNSVLSSDIHYENVYMRGFLQDVYLRPSCYGCQCKGGKSHSDLTIADFWSIDLVSQDFNDDNGVGLVLINTSKGNESFSRLDMDILPSTLEMAHQYNGGFNEHTKPHIKREKFFKLLQKHKTVEQAFLACMCLPLSKRIQAKCKRAVKMVVKFILGDKGVMFVKKQYGDK